MKNRWGEKPYYSFDYYLKETFHSKTYKISLNAGVTCPNRDGTIGTGGCIFCSAGGSGEFAGDRNQSITQQLEEGIQNLSKFHADQYIAYFQAYTNTYAPIEYLERIYREAASHRAVCALSIATRPDCIDEPVVELLQRISRIKPVWIELGLQTMHEKTAEYIRRGYPLSRFEQAMQMLKAAGIPVIVHVILGLPGETKEDMLATIRYLNGQKIQGIKLQLLHVIEGTDLAEDYRKGLFKTLSMEEYLDLVTDCVGWLDESIVIHRLTGDGPSDSLISPLWSRKKMQVLNAIHHELKKKEITQGSLRERDRHLK